MDHLRKKQWNTRQSAHTNESTIPDLTEQDNFRGHHQPFAESNATPDSVFTVFYSFILTMRLPMPGLDGPEMMIIKLIVTAIVYKFWTQIIGSLPPLQEVPWNRYRCFLSAIISKGLGLSD